MTLAQQNFKKAIAYRKKTNCSLKEAFAHVKCSKVAAIPKKKAAKKVGAYKIVEVGEKASTPPKIVQVKRRLDGTFKSFNTIGAFFDVSVIKDIDQLKKQYFKLAKIYHPDKGGTTVQFQELGKEYDKLLKAILRGSNLTAEQQQNEIEIDDAIKIIIDNIIGIDGLDIELIGKWLWVGSSLFQFTTPTYNLLKSVGLSYIKKGGKPFMVYKGVESKSRGKMSKEDIEKKYGVHKFEAGKGKKIGALKQQEIKNKTKVLAAFKKLTNAINKRPI